MSNFNRFNLIYGWNGSGKTTLSRLFAAIGGSNEEPSLEYEIEDEQGKKYKHNDQFVQKVRVFNQDYIKNNIKILEGRANAITVMLGQENKELVDQIQTDEELRTEKSTLLSEAQKEKKQKENDKDEKFTEVAKTIGNSHNLI